MMCSLLLLLSEVRKARAWLPLIALALIAGFSACDRGPAGPGDRGLEGGALPPGLTVSEPVEASGGGGLAGSSDGVIYISASPGTFPDGVSATITNLANGESLRLDIEDGGFDPVSLKAVPDDELEIVVQRRDGSLVVFRARVPRRKRPRVVRTVPVKDATEVVLNSSAVVAFSEPVDSNTVTDETVKLLLDGEPVAGALRLSEDGLRVEFTPAEPLQPEATYTLIVTTGIADIAGDALQDSIEVAFVTETAPPPPMQLDFAAVSAGDDHTCGATTSGEAYCWGRNSSGQLGDGSTTDSWTPVAVSGGLTFLSVEAGGRHTCGLTTGGSAYCWGARHGLGGLDPLIEPTPVGGELTFSALSVGREHTCGLTSGGAAYCWGSNSAGQLGIGTLDWEYGFRGQLRAVTGNLSFTSIHAGGYHTCGLTTEGTAYCWGSNYLGELGSSSSETCPWTLIYRGIRYNDCSTTPQRVTGEIVYSALSLGGAHTCGLGRSPSTQAYCWGFNVGGQLGDGSTASRSTPAPASGGLSFASLSADGGHTCGVTPSGAVYCWGYNYFGQLGNGSWANTSLTPGAVSGGLSFASLSAGGGHTCGVTTSGAAYCWGDNQSGQLGDGSRAYRLTPVRVSGAR